VPQVLSKMNGPALDSAKPKLRVAAPKVPVEKHGRKPLTVLGEDDRLRFRVGIHYPSFFMKQIHQIPIEPLPHTTTVMKRQGQDRKRSFRQLVAVNFVGQSIR
jgi:hypothetical protein